VRSAEKKILGLTIGGHSLVHLFEGVLPPLIPLLIGEFDTDYFHLALIVTAFSYAFGLGSLPAGIVADRVGPRRLITLYLFGAGLLSVAIWPVKSLWGYGIMMGLIGLFCSTYHPSANALLSLSMTRRGNAFGIHGIAGSLGVASVPILSAGIGAAFGWRSPHILFGLVGIGLGCYAIVIGRYLSVPERKQEVETINPSGSASPGIQIVLFYLSAATLGISYKGIMTFLPSYLGEQVLLDFLHLDSVTLGGAMATLALLFGALGQYWAGRLVDRLSTEKFYLLTITATMFFALVMAWSGGMILVAAAVGYALFHFSTQPTQNYIIAKYLPAHRQGLGYGIHFALIFGIGSTAAPVAGYLADHFGLQAVFIAMGLCYGAAVLLSGSLVLKVNRSASAS
jgi:MFS family permease